MSQNWRVLSIQSHVVSGYVGNKSATFPLQLLGFEVDAINSVQFSNHTGYKEVRGQILNEKDIEDLIEGLQLNHIDYYTHLLTGYIGSAAFLNAVADVVKKLRKTNPNLIYVCDPVLGDNGKMYVPEELKDIYINKIIPLADIITPNQYEVELLTGSVVNSSSDAWKAIDKFHEKGCKTVVISSTSSLSGDSQLLAMASSIQGGQRQKLTINIPILNATFTGTGDLFSALFLAWMAKTNNNLKESLEKVLSTEHAILKRTLSFCNNEAEPKNNLCRKFELKLIQSKREIENPQKLFTAEELLRTILSIL
ncbi:pyridoxal kinase [Lycorma delicatula]|uniref:pyridoxal kinase n=1 Tax=Lycorma delicatula TaxID=130591 RepID=UPI003F51A103